MPKATILDRLAGAMETLGKREGKALTPRQRVAAAQRWNSLAGISEDEIERKGYELTEEGLRPYGPSRAPEVFDELRALEQGAVDLGLRSTISGDRADNPFLSDNIDKYEEQSEFLDWCRYNGLEPNGRNLKTFRWERYKGMTIPQRERIYDNYDQHFLPEEKMWRSRDDMLDYLPVGWDNSSNWRY